MVNYPIFSKKYIDDLPLEIDTHRHYWTSKMISEPVRIFLKQSIIFYLYYIGYIYTLSSTEKLPGSFFPVVHFYLFPRVKHCKKLKNQLDRFLPVF